MGSHFGGCSGNVERGGCESLLCQASLCVRIGMESGLCFADEKIAFAQRDTPLAMSIHVNLEKAIKPTLHRSAVSSILTSSLVSCSL